MKNIFNENKLIQNGKYVNTFYIKIFLTKVFLRNLFFFLRNDIFLATRSSKHIRDSSNKVDAELLNDLRDPLQYKMIFDNKFYLRWKSNMD